MKDISRRDFLKYLSAGAIGIIAKPKIPFNIKKRSGRASDVIQCYDQNATSGGTVNESVVQIMLDESIKRLTGISNVGEAWKSIFSSITQNSIIGIKVNCINRAVPTRPEFVNCIVNGLVQMDFGGANYQRNNVVIWDRSDTELSNAGYTIYDGNDPDTLRCFGTNHPGVGYDSNTPLDVPGGPVYPSGILSILIDYLINVAVLKNHGTAQVTLTLKNHYGSTNPVPSHNSYCNPGIPALNQQIRDVITPNNIQKIFITDTLWASVVNGPGGSPNWNPKKLLMSLDTVACDYRGWEVINEERVGSGYSPIPWPVYHIQTAEQDPYNLGTTDVNLIEINNPSNVEESTTIKPTNGVIKVAPNPFQKKTTIMLFLTHASSVHLDMINSSGQTVARIYQGQLSQGKHRIDYNVNKKLPTGTYFIRLYNQGETRIQKVTIIN